MRELVEVRKKRGFPESGFQALLGFCSLLENPDYDLSQIDKVVLLTPIFAGRPAPALNTFLKNANFEGKKVFVVTLGEDPRTHQGAISRIRKKVEAKKGTFIGSRSYRGASLIKKTFYFTPEDLKNQAQEVTQALR